jgi:molybdopterin-guanine dinucleotide biosynthesis protein A
VRWTAAILNGGRASRFGGRDKGALVVDGRTILERQMAVLLPRASEILMVGGGTSNEGVRLVADVVPGCGPLGGVHAALSEAAHPVTVVVACDMPYLSWAWLDYLAGLAAHADAVVPLTEDGYHPLCAAYTRACLDPFAARLSSRRYTMMDALAEVKVRVVEAGDIERFGRRHQLLANVNTPDEYGGLAALRNHEA